MDIVETLSDPEVQMTLFTKAFYYVKNKYGKVSLGTCLECFLNKNIPKDYVLPVGMACLSMIIKHSSDFETIQIGLTNKMKQSIVDRMTSKFN